MRATLSQLSKPARSGKVPIIPIFVGGLLALVLAGGCKSPEPPRDAGRTYQNPVYAGDMPDPSVRKLGKYYYAFGTTGAGRLPDGRIFTLLRSRNLVDWEKLGGALVPPTNNPAFQYWAPEIAEHRGKYYLYYSMGLARDDRSHLGVELHAVLDLELLRALCNERDQYPLLDRSPLMTRSQRDGV